MGQAIGLSFLFKNVSASHGDSGSIAGILWHERGAWRETAASQAMGTDTTSYTNKALDSLHNKLMSSWRSPSQWAQVTSHSSFP